MSETTTPKIDYIYQIANHLLPEGWQVKLEPAMGKPTDAAIIDEIKQIYPKAISTPTQKWRNKRRNRRCYFCRNYVALPDSPWNSHDLIWCEAKGQTKRLNTTRCFCKLFELKEEKAND